MNLNTVINRSSDKLIATLYQIALHQFPCDAIQYARIKRLSRLPVRIRCLYCRIHSRTIFALMAGREAFHTIHNYIDTDEMILRKGAIAAHSGEKVLIPINMRDGSVLAVGKGNPEWNYSAPHGAGRLMSRTKAKANLSMDEYRETMKGIYTTSINENTLDEAPMAYKSLEDIIDVIRESVDVIDVMKPIYNFKASD